MKMFLLALLSFAPQAICGDQKCFTGTVKHGDTTFTKDNILEHLWPGVSAAIVSVANDDPDFKAFLKTRGTCQMDCLQNTVMLTLSNLFGKLGVDLFNQEQFTQHLIDEALTGAFRACYPAPPREEIAAVVQKIRAHIGEVEETKSGFPAGVACKNEGKQDEFHSNDFTMKFKSTFMKSVANSSDMSQYFETEAKDCQKTCIDKTVPWAALTLFLIDNHDDKKAIDSLSGAVSACFPRIPHPLIHDLVNQTKNLMDVLLDDARIRLYAGDMIVKSGSFGFFPLFGLVTALSLLLFTAGFAVGRRWKRSPFEQAETDEADEFCAVREVSLME